ncbi:T9SS type A sorting domain-containing protein [Natronoflexus pectinivorans]|uniref:Putative secreted protein (Por secretion system target) n=1 Tax=Natronoflexus pectinivorans TaxID=682526 RepID=A0A4R2GMU1_9BACT|nr:T9SS type A sorting domain-containing protein [Natronoflexus pectinivorans]TCO09749.1 putative secreted protein (Por secretion system target) [Natronoflexus pectinivorans]
MKRILLKKAILILFVLIPALSFSQSVTIEMRPAQIDISTPTSKSAILVTLTDYERDDARYRLFNSSNQYRCWDSESSRYITSTSYADAPLVLGTPSSSTTFWILFERGNNISTAATYRDRLGPNYGSNYQTQALPAAQEITNPVYITQNDIVFDHSDYSEKHVVLAFDAASNLISATSTDDEGNFTLVYEAGTVLAHLELRSVLNDVLDTKALEITKVSAPTFTPNGGNFFEEVEVTISSATDGATVFYKTNEEDEWETYTEAFTISETTTVWAYAEMEDMDDSDVSSATFQFPIEVSSIAELRDGNTDGTYYHLTSEVFLTFATSNRNQKFVQDATGAVLIDDDEGIITTQYDLYDGIKDIVGTLSVFQDMLQLIPAKNTPEANSVNNSITPEVVTLEDLTSAHQGMLVTILKATIDPAGDETFAEPETYSISDDSGSGSLRVYANDLDFIGEAIPTAAQDITGVIHQRFAVLRLVPRFAADITPSSTVNIPLNETGSFSIFPNPVKDVLSINSAEAIRLVEVYNAVGSLVLSSAKNATDVTLNMSNLPGGIYLVKLTYTDGTIAVQKVVKQ